MDAFLFLGGVLDRDALPLLLLDADASNLSPSGCLAALLIRDYLFLFFLSVLALVFAVSRFHWTERDRSCVTRALIGVGVPVADTWASPPTSSWKTACYLEREREILAALGFSNQDDRFSTAPFLFFSFWFGCSLVLSDEIK